jgi:hypothetical protein
MTNQRHIEICDTQFLGIVDLILEKVGETEKAIWAMPTLRNWAAEYFFSIDRKLQSMALTATWDDSIRTRILNDGRRYVRLKSDIHDVGEFNCGEHFAYVKMVAQS